MVLDTTEAVIEVIWDIVLAFFIIRISIVYAILNFTIWAIFSYLASNGYLFTPLLSPSNSEFLAVSLRFMLVVLSAWFVEFHYEIPLVYWFRLAIGGLSLLLMALAEFLATWTSTQASDATKETNATIKVRLFEPIMLAAILLMPAGQVILHKEFAAIRAQYKRSARAGNLECRYVRYHFSCDS